MRSIGKVDTQKVTHTIIENILKDYPVINSLDTHEDACGAIIRLDLGGFKKGEANSYSYPVQVVD